ncbi:MAG TPA: hypothetical protein VKR58_09545, partial [Aquella sp.]|nr:hypothetical protein [Aquella sp.]
SFLRSGVLFLPILGENLISYKNNKINIFEKYENILIIDGDNLYFHIGPLFRIKDPRYYYIVLYKRDNISRIFGTFYAPGIQYEIIRSLDIEKDSIDVNITALVTYLRLWCIIRNNPSKKNFYMTSGDEFVHELILLSEDDIYNSNQRGLVSFERIQSQIIVDGNPERDWSFDINDIDNTIFGNITAYPYGDNIEYNEENINDFLHFQMHREYQPLVSPWFINLIKTKNISELEMYPEFDDVRGILKLITVTNFNEFRKESRRSESLLEKYLVLTGSKYFTMGEIRRLFFIDHYQYLLEIGAYNRPMVLEGLDLGRFLNNSIRNRERLYYVYPYARIDEFFYKNLDIPIALGVTRVEVVEIDGVKHVSTLEFKSGLPFL